MMTTRSHDQFNTTIYGLHDRYRGIYNERRVVFINPNATNKIWLNSYKSFSSDVKFLYISSSLPVSSSIVIFIPVYMLNDLIKINGEH